MIGNPMIARERSYDVNALAQEADELTAFLNEEQRAAYEESSRP